MALALCLVGLFGVLGLTIFFPLMALPFFLYQNFSRGATSSSSPSPAPVTLVEILIPAHNEEASILATLHSVRRSIEAHNASRRETLSLSFQIHVAADGCSDLTVLRARSEPGVHVTEFPEKNGKWAALKKCVSASTADWIVLTDAGTLWPETLLSDVTSEISRNPRALCIAPSYRPTNAGLLHRLIWDVEMALKWFEGFCGGPVSVHGATVSYRVQPLKTAFAQLGEIHWINDDVVLPLTLRSLNTGGVIAYPVGRVIDVGFSPRTVDLNRRRRLTMGNIQWIQGILGNVFSLNVVAGLLACRRIFRMLWAYWGAVTVLALMVWCPRTILPLVVGFALLNFLSGSIRQFSGAALVSWSTPLLILRAESTFEVRWK